MINVAVVDDHPLVRRGLRETLAAASGVRLVAEAARPDEVIPLLRAQPCDVLVLDLSLPGRGGFELLADVRREFPAVRVLVVSTYPESLYGVRALEAGASGYVAKTAAADELVTAIRTVVARGRYVSEGLAEALAEHAVSRRPGPGHERLSAREHQVLCLLAAGKTVSGAAVELCLSVKTVSTYRTRLLQKLGLETTADLVRYAVEQGLVE